MSILQYLVESMDMHTYSMSKLSESKRDYSKEMDKHIYNYMNNLISTSGYEERSHIILRNTVSLVELLDYLGISNQIILEMIRYIDKSRLLFMLSHNKFLELRFITELVCRYSMKKHNIIIYNKKIYDKICTYFNTEIEYMLVYIMFDFGIKDIDAIMKFLAGILELDTHTIQDILKYDYTREEIDMSMRKYIRG